MSWRLRKARRWRARNRSREVVGPGRRFENARRRVAAAPLGALAISVLPLGAALGIDVVTALLGVAPLGDPLEFELRGYRLSLRRAEARRIKASAS